MSLIKLKLLCHGFNSWYRNCLPQIFLWQAPVILVQTVRDLL